MPAINIGDDAEASVESAYVPARDALDPPPGRLARPPARRRDAEASAVHTARQFGRAIIMPNLVPPVTTAAAAAAYRDRILAALPAGSNFTPLMTCYLTDGTDPAESARAARGRVCVGGQALSGACHHQLGAWRDRRAQDRAGAGGDGRRSACRCWSTARSPIPTVDIFDREAVFLDEVLAPLLAGCPG